MIWPRYRRPALTSAAVAATSGAAGAGIICGGATVTGKRNRSPIRAGFPRMCCGNMPCWPTGNAALCSVRGATSSGCALPGGTATRSSPRCWTGPGGYSITPVDRFVWGGFYEPASMIWRSRWITHRGVIECREALAFPGDPHRAVLLRRVTAVEGDAAVRITLAPRAGFGRHGLTRLHTAEGSWTGGSGPLHLRWTGAPASTRPIDRHEGLMAGLLVPAGGHHDLVLEISDQVLPDEPPDPDAAWEATETALGPQPFPSCRTACSRGTPAGPVPCCGV